MDESLNRFKELVIPYEDTRLVLYDWTWWDENRTTKAWVPGIDIDAYPALRDLDLRLMVNMLNEREDSAIDACWERHQTVFKNVSDFFADLLKVNIRRLATGVVRQKMIERPEGTPQEQAVHLIEKMGEERRDPLKVKYFIFYTEPAYETPEEAKKVAINIADICEAISNGRLQAPVV